MSVTLSENAFGGFPQVNQDVSPKKASFLDSLMGRNSPKSPREVQEKPVKSPSWSIFSKKSQQTPPAEAPAAESEYDRATAELIEQLLQEGRAEQDINMHLSYIHDAPIVAPSPAIPQQKESTSLVTQFFKDVQQAFKENFGPMEPIIVPAYDIFEDDLRGITVGLSSAPFFGALPHDSDLSYEELASLEPVYVGAGCINNLPQCIHDGTPLPGDQTKCTVCLEDLKEGECLKSLPCVHFYHKDCIDSWLMVGHTCPVCKFLVE